MASDLRDQLQSTLSGSYTLERELGGGGMSRVFLADEPRLGRKVVVKVLSPELAAGLNVERFEREIKLAASLQQANIVPVLTAGDTNGLPFYTMPFVDGDSLRRRLQDGPLGVTEAISILRDVARALSYAHEHGVVHRDIKPDNVLISGGTAVVTDFGIAKALAAAKRGNDSDDGQPDQATTLTALGTSIGTPAYMSPEQVAGDPNVDHRSDIYAFGCMAYELLAGNPPFHGRTAQRVLAAHLAEAPRPIAELRHETPPALANLIMRSLEKDPAARPESAAELVRSLESVTTGSGVAALSPADLNPKRGFVRALAVYAAASVAVALIARAAVIALGLPDWVFPGAIGVAALGLPVVLYTGYLTTAKKVDPRIWRRTAHGGAYALGVFVLSVLSFMVLRAFGIGPAGSLLAAGTLNHSEPLLVADFKTSDADSALSGVLAEAMRTNLGESRVISVMPASSITAALQRMRRPANSRLDVDLARDVAQREGVKAVVAGALTPAAGGYLVTARLLAAKTGDDLASFQESADSPKDLIGAVDRLARKLRGRIGESLKAIRADPPLEQVSTTSLDALRKYAEGSRANDVDADYPTAIRLLEEAVALDTTFGMAYRKLAQAIQNSGGPQIRRIVAIEKAYEYRDRMTERERLVTIATYHNSGRFADRRRAVEAYESLLKRYPEPAWYQNLANIFVSLRESARADSAYRLALTSRGFGEGSAFQHFNIVNTELDLGNIAGAKAALRDAAARFPNDERIDLQGAGIAYAEGQLDSVAAIAQRLTRARSLQRQLNGENGLASLSLLRGRVGEYVQHVAKARALNASRGQAPPAIVDSISTIQLEALVFDRPSDAARRLDALFATTPIASMPPDQRPLLAAAIAYGMAGRADRARSLLAENDREQRDSLRRRAEEPGRHSALAWIAVAAGKPLDAVAEFRKGDMRYDGPVSACLICVDVPVGLAFDRANMPDSAIAAFEHYVNTPWSGRLGQDAVSLPGVLRRLGELYEAKGERAKAMAAYARFVELWKDADAPLQSRVVEARKRLARLNDLDKR